MADIRFSEGRIRMENEQLVWDCVEYKEVWEAEQAVKFPVFIPMVLGTEAIRRIAVIGKELVDIQYTNDIRYRTAKGTDDISGNYNKFDKEDEFEVTANDTTYSVTAKGAYKKIFLATWKGNGYSYSIYIPHGVLKKHLEELIQSLTQVNSCGIMTNASCPNPIAEYDYIFEAEYAAGFKVVIPAVLETNALEHIYVIAGKVVELNYKNGIIYRTAKGNKDISGIYATYPYIETFEEVAFHVTVQGNMDLYYVSTWTGYGMTGWIYSPHGIHKKNLIELINSMRQTDASNSMAEEELAAKTALGAYTSYHVVTEKETALFNEAMHLIGVNYEPLLAATQLVAGTNYRFICNAKVAAWDNAPYLAQVTIFVPISSETLEKPVVTNIKRLN